MKPVLRTMTMMSVLALAAAAGAETRYHIVDLDATHGSAARGINNHGQIVGYTIEGHVIACIFDPNGGDPLLLGGHPAGSGSGRAFDISDAGQIVGDTQGAPPDLYVATLFDPTGGGANIDLGTLGGNSSCAYAVNDAGEIIGFAKVAGNWNCPTLFDPTGGGDNVSFSGDEMGGDAYGINNSGLVVGSYAYNSVSPTHAALWDISGGPVVDLGLAGNGWGRSFAEDINEFSQIVGWANRWELAYTYAILYEASGAGGTVIGPLYSEAYAINDPGVAVGCLGDGTPNRWAAKFEPIGGGGWRTVNLNDVCDPNHWMTGTLGPAWDINNDGWIVGIGGHAFLLKPITPGDLDYDCDVDISDLAQLLANYNTTSGATYEQGDIDEDGDVDISDLAALLAVYGQVCP